MVISEYHQNPAISQSDLKLFRENPRLFYERKLCGCWPDDKTTDALEFGRMVDAWLLGQLMEIPAEVLSKSGSRAGKAWKEFEAAHAGMVLVKPADFAILKIVEKSIARHPRAKRILFEHPSERHVQFFWDCPHTDLPRKAELDLWLHEHNVIGDVKTTQDPSPRAFERQAFQLGYHIQGYTYIESVEACTEVEGFFFVAIRNSPPYDVEVHELSPELLADAERWNERWMKRLKKALDTDDWGPVTSEKTNILCRPRGWAGHVWDD